MPPGIRPRKSRSCVGSIDWVDLFNDETDREAAPMRQKETDDGNLIDFEIGVVDGRVSYPTALVTGQKLSLLLRSWFLGRSELEELRRPAHPVSRRGHRYRRRPAGDLRLR